MVLDTRVIVCRCLMFGSLEWCWTLGFWFVVCLIFGGLEWCWTLGFSLSFVWCWEAWDGVGYWVLVRSPSTPPLQMK